MRPEYTERFMRPKMEYYRECYKDSQKWDGEEDLKDKTVILYGEQGLGDILQFARYIPTLQNKGCKIIFHCPRSLQRLFQNNFDNIIGFIDKEEESVPELPEHDYHIPTMSLPFLLGTHEADLPYLSANKPEGFEDFEDKFKIGIAWEGNPEHSNNDSRSCPLAIFRKISQIEDVNLFMIQKQVQLSSLSMGCDDIEILGVELNDFQDTAELIAGMDLVISVDTSVLHLAGAMGKKSIGLLSYTHDPRWDLEIDWYPSVDLLTQKITGDWAGISSDLNMRVNMSLQKWNLNHPAKS